MNNSNSNPNPKLDQALLQPKLEGIEDSANEIGFVTYQVTTTVTVTLTPT